LRFPFWAQATYGSRRAEGLEDGAVTDDREARPTLSRIMRSYREHGLFVLGTQLAGVASGSVRNHLIAHKLRVKKIRIGPRPYLRGLSSVGMGEDCQAGAGLWLEAVTRYNDQTFSPKIIIGDHARISNFVHIAATNMVEIGDNVLMGSKVVITDHNHGQYSNAHSSPHIAPSLRPLDHDRRVLIGRNVWLGDGVVVTPGATIGDGCVIGANSVVVGNIAPFTIAAGVPAQRRKTFLFDTEQWSDIK
jgi:lipopolysaccharide O-acetyltransferase